MQLAVDVDEANPLHATFTASGVAPPLTWGWGDGESATGALVQSHEYPRTGLYTVQVRSSAGVKPTQVGVGGVARNGPWIERLSPSSAQVGGAAVTMRVFGRNFTAASKVIVAGAEAATTFVSSTELTAPVTPAAVPGPRTVWVQVREPTPNDAGVAVISNGIGFQLHAWPLSTGVGNLEPEPGEPEPEPEPPEEEEEEEEAAAYDPGSETVADVLAYVDAHPDELQAVYDAETAGKARVTLLDGLRERGASG